MSASATTLPAHTLRGFARQSLVLLCRCLGFTRAARFGSGICACSGLSAASPVAVGLRAWSASAARRFQWQSASGGFGRAGDYAALFVNLGRLTLRSASARVAVGSGAVFVRAVRHNPWLRATQRRAVCLARASALS